MSDIGNHKEIKALISFLDETDETILETIQEKLFLMGRVVLPSLEEAAHATFNETSNNRIVSLINRIRRHDVKDEFSAWLKTDLADLLKGYLIISKLQYPELNEEELTIEVEQMKLDAWLELNDNLTALENVKVINHIFFQLYHFEGNKENANIPEEQYLPAILNSHKGNSLSLGILYLIIARKLNLPIAGVDLPEQFILAYLADEHLQSPSGDEVLFYINPFKGSVFTRREVEMFLRQLKIKANIKYFTPCSNREVIIRLITALRKDYEENQNREKVEELNDLLQLIK